MKESTKNAICKLAELTKEKCMTCIAGEHRCCDAVFCEASAITMKSLGGDIKPTGHPTLLFMGENGCVLPPEYRPGCSGYVCPSHLTGRSFRREHKKLHDKVFADADVQAAMKKTQGLILTHMANGLK